MTKVSRMPPMTLDELAARLADAAQAELFSVNIMECGAARVGAPFVLTDVLRQTRRQGEALGLAHKIALALKANPTAALGLGLAGIAELEGLDAGAATEGTAA